MAIVKIEIPVEQDSNDKKRHRKILVPLDAISLEDWMDVDRVTPIPNKCRVSVNGQVYKALIGKEDLIKEMEGLGVVVHRVKAI